jgi:hypothetical protein
MEARKPYELTEEKFEEVCEASATGIGWHTDAAKLGFTPGRFPPSILLWSGEVCYPDEEQEDGTLYRCGADFELYVFN